MLSNSIYPASYFFLANLILFRRLTSFPFPEAAPLLPTNFTFLLNCLVYFTMNANRSWQITVGDTRSPRSVASWHFRRHYFLTVSPVWGDMALPFVCIPDQSWPNCASYRELPVYSQVCMPNIPLTSPIPNNHHSMSIATRFCACGTKQA